MRILHTSDWHLGIRHGPASRAPDHDAFFAWLLLQLAEDAVDALIIAGDIFDGMQPSADALARWYRFLLGVRGTGVTQVVVIGGNHDSPARLDAPAAVLGALDVHVVGGLDASDTGRTRCIVPLKDRTGAVRAVCLAVPYVHEFRLGVRTTDLDTAGIKAAFRERFAGLYSGLVDAAQAAHPGLPLVATGHLTVGSQATREDYPHEIHQVGTLDALPADVLDPRIQYTALGHIHRCYPVDAGRRAWYSGSPIAFSLPEGRTARRVLRVDLSDDPQGTPDITRLDVPAARALVELREAPDDLVARVQGLQWSEPLPPLLFCRAVTDALPSDLSGRLHDALAAHPEDRRPVLAELRQERATPLAGLDEDAPALRLDELRPEQVFDTLLKSQGLSGDDGLRAAFARIASAAPSDFDAMLRAAREGQA
jgi:DNA repair protein SbcD/Mre11